MLTTLQRSKLKDKWTVVNILIVKSSPKRENATMFGSKTRMQSVTACPICFLVYFFWAYSCVHSLAVLIASGWFSCFVSATLPPLQTHRAEVRFTYLPLLCHSLVQRVLGVGSTKQSLDTEQDCADLKSRRPVVLEHVQADTAESVDVRVVDAGQEAYAGWAHGVVVR